jgi:hypothetical protein
VVNMESSKLKAQRSRVKAQIVSSIEIESLGH